MRLAGFKFHHFREFDKTLYNLPPGDKNLITGRFLFIVKKVWNTIIRISWVRERKGDDKMAENFILSCESTVDLPYEEVNARKIPILFYSYSVDDSVYPDDMGRDPDALPRLYQWLAEGKRPSTSQLNAFAYETFLEELVQKGDVLHIAFGSGMTGSAANAQIAVEHLRKQYPERKIEVIDSLCSSSGYGLLVDLAADLRDSGCSWEETRDWVLEHRKKIHHQFFSTDLTYFRRSGRISGPAAMLGTVMSICPIMRLDDSGHILAYDKVRGKKKAMERTVQTMVEYADRGEQYTGKCFISHANCPEDAQLLKTAIQAQFPKIGGEIRIYDIGAIIASHCGPGTVAVFFLGEERMPYDAGKEP